jgi:hypothetical protein
MYFQVPFFMSIFSNVSTTQCNNVLHVYVNIITAFNEIAKHRTKLLGVGTRINPHHVLKEYYIQDGYLSTSCIEIYRIGGKLV